MWYYKDYLKVEENLIDVYSEEEDRHRKEAWKGFIPHDDFQNLFEKLIIALDRGDPARIKPPWIYGAYGTGKTFACFVIKHLFEEPDDVVERYIQDHDKIKHLAKHFLELRKKGRWLVAYNTSSSHITSTTTFLSSIQEAIKRTLGKSDPDFSDIAASTFKENVIKYLKESPAIWKDIFEKYQLSIFASYESPEDVLSAMRGSSNEALTLIEKVASTLEKDFKVVLYSTPDETKQWLRQVIETNQLAGIIFIWDEFTDFFHTTKSYSGLQELAHAAKDIHFYFIPVTHLSPEILKKYIYTSEEKTIEKLYDRFFRIRFQLQHVTAYELAGNAIKVKNADIWEDKRVTLWSHVEQAARLFLKDEAREEHFKKLIPLHPYTAFLLSVISQGHSSSQRSLFRYLKSREQGAFPWFLERYPGDTQHFWITPDFLWDYFFSQGRDDSISSSMRNVITYYESRADQIKNKDQLSIFKTIMLLNALYYETPDDRLKPTKKNLQIAFFGQSMDNILIPLSALVTLGYINKISLGGDNEEYAIPLYAFDEEELRRIQEEVERANDFTTFVDKIKYEVGSFVKNIGIFENRIGYKAVSVEELLRKREGINPKLEAYQVGIVVLVPKTEAERFKAVEVCRRCAQKSENVGYVLLKPAFGEENYMEWLKNKAHARYANTINDLKNEKHYESRAKDIVEEYQKRLKIEEQELFFKKEEKTFSIGQFENIFRELVFSVFPYCYEKLTELQTLYKEGYHKAAFEVGLEVTANVTRQYTEINRKLKEFESGKEKSPLLSEVKKKVRENIEGQNTVRVVEIWEELQKPPFGMTSMIIGKVLFGFAMKEYCDGSYYWSDGTDCKPLSREGMRDLLIKVVTKAKGSDQLEIRRLSPEIEKFCRVVQRAFGIHDDDVIYPEPLKNKLRDKIKDLSYPLWALKYVPPEDESISSVWDIIIEGIESFIKSEKKREYG